MKELKAKLLRKLGRSVSASAKASRPRAGVFDATAEPDPGPPPEAIFDRTTGPFSSPSYRLAPGTRIGGS